MAAKKKKKRKPSGKKSAASRAPGAGDYLKRWRAMKNVDEEDVAMFSDDLVPNITEFIPTGSLAIDKLINGENGGWPIGGISECAAWEHVGKSTLLDQSIAQCQRMGGVAVLIDSEKGRDREWTELLGVNSDELLVKQADTLEESFGSIEEVCEVQQGVIDQVGWPPPPMLIVQDSLGGTPSKAELDGDPDDSHMAVAARVIKMNFRRLTQRLIKLRVAYVFTNHFYNKIGGYGGLVTYGGSGVRYHTDLRLWLKRPSAIKIADKEVGHVVTASSKKNRISGTKDPVDTGLIYGAGMDNAYTLFAWGQKHPNPEGNAWIVRNGAWYYLFNPGEDAISFQRQSLGLGEIFTERHDIYQTMAQQYLRS